MVYDSGLERDFLRLCDFDPSITDFQSQPFQLEYWLDGRERSYTPDVLIGSDRLIEVKPENRTSKLEFQRWVGAVREACANRGYTFEVVTDIEIRRQPRLDNVLLLRRYHRQPVHEDVRLNASEWVREAPGIPLSELLERLGRTERALADLYGLLACHAVQYDIHQPIGSDLPIFPIENNRRNQ